VLFRFEGFELDDDLFSLRRGETDIEIRPQALDVLVYLIKNRERIVTKRELLDEVWRGTTVTENTILQAIVALRRALVDDDEQPRMIQTVRARGYRFIAKVDVWSEGGQAQSPSPTPTRHQAVIAAEEPSSLIGRADALRTIEETLEQAAKGGGLLLISGGAGVGKTRLLSEIAKRAHARSMTLLTASSRAATDGAPDLWPWVEMFRRVADPLLKALASDLAAAESTESGGHFRMFDRVVQALEALASTAPVAVLIDDLHAADVPTLLLLKLASTSLHRRSRVVFALAYRDTNLPPTSPLLRTLGALAREEGARSLPLRGFTRDDIRTLLGPSASATATATDEEIDRVLTKTDGNPLLVVQMTSAPRGQAGKTTSALLAVTEMREAVALQLSDLSSEAITLLSAASVLGPRLALSHLAAMMETRSADLLPMLDEVIAARVLVREHSGDLRFLHVLVRDVLYRKLSSSDRVKLHRRAGLALLDAGMSDQAIDHLERALRTLGRVPPEEKEDRAAHARELIALADALVVSPVG
jgi:DNA-binding winged helix-turn-helix (wHTH) protein/predicted ATPase